MNRVDSRNFERAGVGGGVGKTSAPSLVDAEFFQAVIDDHRRRPRHRGPLPTANRVASRENPLCGDRCTIQLQLVPDFNALGTRILAAGFTGAGCALSQASASLLVSAITGRTVGELRALAASVDAWVRTGAALSLPASEPSLVSAALPAGEPNEGPGLGIDHDPESGAAPGADARLLGNTVATSGDVAALAAAHAYPARHACALLAWQAALAALDPV